MRNKHLIILAFSLSLASGCLSAEPEGIAPATPAKTTVKMDFRHRPLPEIPLPNDIATRLDTASATGRRVNASMVAPTAMESLVRERIDSLDGWGVFQPISIPFTGPLDINSITDAHRDADYDLSDDVVYLVNIDRDSPEYGRVHHLDVGNGNYPVILEKIDNYWKNDPRGWLISILFEEADEDLNGNGMLDPGEDTDADGVLDVPNYLPGLHPAQDDLAGRADALMTFYERETNTLILKPLVPLRERTTYGVLVTRRLKDANGDPVGSPFPWVNHAAQTEALMPMLDVLPAGVKVDDIAFAFSYTTETIEANWKAVRDGLYGHGVQKHIGEEFPAEVGGLLPLRDEGHFDGMTNPYLMYTENWLPVYKVIASQFQGATEGTVAFQQILDNNQYVDYHIIGYYESPQLFDREGPDGNWLPFDAQSWPQDLDRIPAKTRSERVYFYMTVPRREVSDRGNDEPAPVVVLGHGYGGNRFDVATFGPFFAKYGLATISIDNVSHGLSISPEQRELALSIIGGFGLNGYAEAVFTDRAYDQNGDGTVDSGADFWTAYLFHTRDVVRQSALDYMQLIRILRSFDGEHRWGFDANGDGQNELAGDFDADGKVDIGGDALITMTGGSLGGMMATFMGSVEPELSAIAPIVPGGGLGDGGIRSQQGGVPEAFILRPMAPLYVGTLGRPATEADNTREPFVPDPAGTQFYIETIVPDLNNRATRLLATLDGVQAGDTLVVVNARNEERGCGFVTAQGTVRAAAASNKGDRTRIELYRGDALVLGSTECAVKTGLKPMRVVDTFEHEVEFQTHLFAQGAPLESLEEGLGLRRGDPALRRFGALGQMVLDPADMAVVAPHIQKEPMTYPGTGQTTGTHIFIIPAVGDMSVPVNMSMSIGRAAGLIDYLTPDPRYDKPINQVLIDTYTAEAVHTLNRYLDCNGKGTHLDLDNFSGGTDIWGDCIPRLDQPLRTKFYETDPLGGRSAYVVAYGDPKGKHGFPGPGEGYDSARKLCQQTCEGPCDCDNVEVFDIGNFFFNSIGRFLSSGGLTLSDDLCQARDDCDDKPALPPARYNPDDPTAEPDPTTTCTFPKVQVAGTPELDAIADAPPRCGANPGAWLDDPTLGAVTAREAANFFPAALLRQLAGQAGITLPREPAWDTSVLPYAYTTQDRGQLVQATALVAWPTNIDTTDPLDVLLFLGEPEGVTDRCATSRDLTQKALMALLASFGYIVVAPEYIGMRGFGPSPEGAQVPYLVAEPAALGALDAVRALGPLGADLGTTCASPNVFLVGSAQGGQAALFADRLAPYYAPELKVVGGVAAALFSNLYGHLRAAASADTTSPALHRLAAFFVQAAAWYGLTDQLDVIFKDGVADTIATRLASTCDLDVLADLPTPADAFTDTFLAALAADDLTPLGDWACVLAENSLATSSVPPRDADPNHAFLFVLGEQDTQVTPTTEQASFEALCADGLALRWLECTEARHSDVVLWALPEILAFLDATLAGTPVTDACTVDAARRCGSQP